MLKRTTKKRIVRNKKRNNGGAAAYDPLPPTSAESKAYKKKFTIANLEEDFKPRIDTQSSELKDLIPESLLILAKNPKVPYPSRYVALSFVAGIEQQDAADKTHREYDSSMTFKELIQFLERKSKKNGKMRDYLTSNPIVELDQDETQPVDDGECQVLSGIRCEDVEKIKKKMSTKTFRLLCICQENYPVYMFFIYEDILRGDTFRNNRRRIFIRITNTETVKRIKTACMSRFEHVEERLHVESPPFMTKVKDVFTSLKTSMRKAKPKLHREGGGMKKSRKSRKYRR
jgi:hypothetical protein